MALQDHFRPPLSVRRHWHAFHSAWATYLVADLNQRLPEGYFAEPNVQFGVEIDIASFEEPGLAADDTVSGLEIGTRLTPDSRTLWSPPGPTQTVPFRLLTDTVEVMILHTEAGPVLVGVIELVSPANRDRPAHRDAFVAKCATYVQQGIGLVMVDVVTGRRADLHDALLTYLVGLETPPPTTELYTVAYRPIQRYRQPYLDIWQETLAIGPPLPTMPLWLRGALCLPVALEATYERTCRE